MQYPRTMSNNTYHSGTITRFSGNHSGNTTLFSGNKREPPPFFHSDTNTWPRSGPFCWQNPCSGSNSGTDLVVTLEYIFYNFVLPPNKPVRLTRFRRSYVNYTAVVLTNHFQNYTAFLLDVCCSLWPRSFFCSWLCPMLVHLRSLFLLSTSVANSKVGKQMKKFEIVIHKYIKADTWS